MKNRLLVVSAALGIIASSASAQEIILRHRLDGAALDTLASLVVRFNAEPKLKGKVVMQDVLGLDHVRDLPHLALFDPDDEGEFLGGTARVRPLPDFMREAGASLGAEAFYPQVADGLTDHKGKLQALPMAMTLPVLMLNRATLLKAGQDQAPLPKTWWEVQKVAGAMFDSGSKCPLTSTRFAWIHLENVSVQHGIPVMVKAGKEVGVNSLVNVKHLALLASWQKSRYFHYSGAADEGRRRFLSGECGMLTGESSIYVEAKRAGLQVSVAPLPHYDDVYGAQPENVLTEGAGLWALAGHPKKDNALTAQFIKFLLRPDVQKEWVLNTGYLPMTSSAAQAFRDSGFPAELLETTQKRLAVSTKGSTRSRVGALRQRLRRAFGEEVAFVWSTDRPAKEALDKTVLRVNEPEAVRPKVSTGKAVPK